MVELAVTVERICQIMEEWAPKRLAAEWDSVGLQIGNPAHEVSRVFVTLEVTPDVARTAIDLGAQMIVCHHPLIFRPIKSLRLDNPLSNVIANLIKNNISVYAAHTNLDMAPGGVDDTLAETLGLKEPRVLSQTARGRYYKVVVFVPVGHEDAVREAMAAAGAGYIGKYSHCTFQTPGTGTFKPLQGANPFIGEVGRVEKVDEYRLETIVSEEIYRRVLAAMIKAHPYEEVAYDVYPLANEGETIGFGRVGHLAAPLALIEFAQFVARALSAPSVRVVGEAGKRVTKVASSCGSGGDQVGKAIFAGADVLVTGDVKYHDAREAEASGLCLVDAGHYYTEAPILSRIKEHLERRAREEALDFRVMLAEGLSDPYWTMGGSFLDGQDQSRMNTSQEGGPVTGEEPCQDDQGIDCETVTEAAEPIGHIVLNIDGASRGNPGMAACAVVISDEKGNTIKEAAFFLGTATNNVAEYQGLLRGLEMIQAIGAQDVTIFSDSELLVRQINGEYAVKDPKLSELHAKALREMARIQNVKVLHVRRGGNKKADALANKAIESRGDLGWPGS